MEKRNNYFKIIAGISVASCVLYFFAFILTTAYYSYSQNIVFQFLDVLNLMYSTNGLPLICFFIIMIVAFCAKTKKEKIIKFLLWAILLMFVTMSAPFFNSIPSFANADLGTVLTFSSAYIPQIATVITLIALINMWHNPNKKSTRKVSFICLIISVCFLCVFLITMVMSGKELALGDVAMILTYLFSGIIIAMINIFVFYISKNHSNFQQAICLEIVEDECKNANVNATEELKLEESEEKATDFVDVKKEESKKE